MTPRRTQSGAHFPPVWAKGCKPLSEYRKLAEAWCSRHHVVESRNNNDAPRNRKAYFDELPRVAVRSGHYHVSYDHPPPESYGLEPSVDRLNRRLANATPETSREVLSRASARSALSPLRRSRGTSRASTIEGHLTRLSHSRAEQAVAPEAVSPHKEHAVAAEDTDADAASRAAKATISLTPILAASAPSKEAAPAPSEAAPAAPDEEARRAAHAAKAKERARIRTESYHFTRPHVEFAEWCDNKRGGLACVWRRVDADGNMCLTKAEFLKGFRKLQYPSPFNELWASLDRDKMGTVSFIEFDPEGALMLARFKRWAEMTFGSVDAAFQKLDTARNGQVDVKEFLVGCLKEPLPPDVKDSLRQVFYILDNADNKESRGNITVQEMAFLHTWKCPPYLWEDPDMEAQDKFKAALLTKWHNNILLAWRKTLDRDGSMKVTYDEFMASCKAVTKIGLAAATPPSGIPALYCSFDLDRSGWFTLRDWDHATFVTLAAFTRWTKAEFGKPSNCVRAWEKEKGLGVGLKAFRRHTAPLGLSDTEANRLFEALSLEKVEFETSKGKIAQHELMFLDTWEASADQAQSSGRRASFRSLETRQALDALAAEGGPEQQQEQEQEHVQEQEQVQQKAQQQT